MDAICTCGRVQESTIISYLSSHPAQHWSTEMHFWCAPLSWQLCLGQWWCTCFWGLQVFLLAKLMLFQEFFFWLVKWLLLFRVTRKMKKKIAWFAWNSIYNRICSVAQVKPLCADYQLPFSVLCRPSHLPIWHFLSTNSFLLHPCYSQHCLLSIL